MLAYVGMCMYSMDIVSVYMCYVVSAYMCYVLPLLPLPSCVRRCVYLEEKNDYLCLLLYSHIEYLTDMDILYIAYCIKAKNRTYKPSHSFNTFFI